ncbi:hypothetical protein C1637_24765 [Chryseobacterium lactis]|uniref:Uncharacterized protein n=1 Tax=Chryseobacterium lactis TaxID=1241981 RepID=A0A3G6RZA5_CHRLC|nr:hypothetical protein [Chryseobacterium lactis]AZA81942.1 hypothetical protein EG342_08485 [Chryseobacterium lactis]AZB06940.1 hypothetical protein EG341_24600 [Chryseobacterium lactis]PNW10990.1 hypothetical protein C1637_24765 [Chryseobacterium lactis]
MAIIKNAKNINIQVANNFTSLSKVSSEEAQQVTIEATKQNLELSSQKKAIMQGFSRGEAITEDEESSTGKITEMYWAYGDEETPLMDSSKFYVDMNLIVETEGYNDGESIEVIIKAEDGEPIAEGLDELTLTGTVKKGQIIFKEPLKAYTLTIMDDKEES